MLPGTTMMQPSLWFGGTTSSTKMHSDCCDNYAMMVAGTKRWTVAPPSEARLLQPKCTGGLCWVKSLEHPDEHARTAKEKQLAAKVQKTTFDLGPGEMLFLPTGWFHHVENLDPTIMVNYWAKGGPAFLKFIEQVSAFVARSVQAGRVVRFARQLCAAEGRLNGCAPPGDASLAQAPSGSRRAAPGRRRRPSQSGGMTLGANTRLWR